MAGTPRPLRWTLLSICLLPVACGDSTSPEVPTSLEVDPLELLVNADETALIQARVLDQDGNAFATPPAGYEIAWSAADLGIAEVEGGTVTGVALGITQVTVSAGDLPSVNVTVRVRSVELDGELSFDYDGEDLTGSFEVASTFRIHPEDGPDATEWVVTFFDADFGSHDVLAEREVEDGVFDLVWFWGMGPEVTSPETRELGEEDGFFALGFRPDEGTVDAAYLVTEGTVDFSSVSGTRIGGSFELSLEHFQDGSVLEITNGSFDAPIVSAPNVLGGAAAAPPSATAAASVQARALRDALLRQRHAIR